MSNSSSAPNTPSLDPSKEIRLLLAFFGESAVPHLQGVAAEDVPEPYRGLLVHHGHMTESLERRHGGPLEVIPYQVHQQGEVYGRKLDLKAPSGRTVMTGIMLINFNFCEADVRADILEERTPLGRILINHNVLRQVSATAFIKMPASDPLISRFGLDRPQSAFGRFATIYCDGVPAVDLMEIVAPEQELAD